MDKFFGDSKTSITPNLDKLISNGTYFSQAISSAASTLKASSSIITGNFPQKTTSDPKTSFVLNKELNTIARQLKKNNYHTFATVPEIFSFTGLIDDYDDSDKIYSDFNFKLHSGLGDKILEKLQMIDKSQPWFYYIHLFDLLIPVISPSKYNLEKFGESQYERTISSIDEWLGKILKNIDLENTIIVITADHAIYQPILNDNDINLEPSPLYSFFWRVGYSIPPFLQPLRTKIHSIYKSFIRKKRISQTKDLALTNREKRILTMFALGTTRDVFDDFLRIPLLFSGWKIPSNKKISNQVRQVDIMPTILDLLEIDMNDEIDGISLSPFFKNKEIESPPAIIENIPTRDNNFKHVIGVRTSDYKYFRDYTDNNENVELYDLKEDPLENNNIATEKLELVKQMEEILNNYLQSITHNSISDNDKEQKVKDELRKMGYL
jgi:arylsulfatase A-like enzyme